ncbi:MAG: hypothetical protein R3F34_08050 [Planctomycetota bacterium]
MKNALVLLLVSFGLLGGVLVAWFLRGQGNAGEDVAETESPVVAPHIQDSVRRPVAAHVDDEPAAPRTAPWVVDNNAAVAALEADDVDRAIELLERAIGSATGDDRAVVAGNLAEALGRRARRSAEVPDLESAVADLERALELDPARDDFERLLGWWRKQLEVERDFASYGSQRFEIVFDGDRDEILKGVQRAVDVLEQAYGEYWLFFGRDPVVERGRRLRVAFYDAQQFQDVTGLGHWAAGAFDGTVRLPIVDYDRDESRWTQTLWHELCHAFLHDMIPGKVPGWLDEGLAQWMEPGRDDAVRAARASLSKEALLPIADMSGTLASIGDPARIRRAYAQSLAFADWIVAQYGEYVVREMVGALARGDDAGARFREVMGFSLEQASADFADSLGG